MSEPASEEPARGLGAGARAALKELVAPARGALEEVGTLGDLALRSLTWAFRRPFRLRLVVQQLEFVGVQSLFLVGLVGLFTGMVFALQTVYGFRRFGAENMVGGVVALTLSREMAPVLTAIMVAARAGSGMAAELGNMRASEQIDALETMAVNPVQYLLVPRLIAGLVMVPVLSLLFFCIGLGGAWIVGVYMLSLDPGIFADRIRTMMVPDDLRQGLIKSVVFGFAVTLIACRHGFYASGGAVGVGQATTRAVVWSVVGVFVLDYLLTTLMTAVT
jgi:phospholipid/cholesterol/gamma-HCH transport system permease protein